MLLPKSRVPFYRVASNVCNFSKFGARTSAFYSKTKSCLKHKALVSGFSLTVPALPKGQELFKDHLMQTQTLSGMTSVAAAPFQLQHLLGTKRNQNMTQPKAKGTRD